MKPPSAPVPRSRWRISTVARVPPAPSGARRIAVSALRSSRSNGLPSTSWRKRRTSGARDSSTRKSARTERPLSVERTSVKRSASTASTRWTRGHQRGRWWGSHTVRQTCSGVAPIVRLRRGGGRGRAGGGLFGVVGDERVHVVAREPLAPIEERQLDQDPARDDGPAELLDEPAQRPGRAAG